MTTIQISAHGPKDLAEKLWDADAPTHVKLEIFFHALTQQHDLKSIESQDIDVMTKYFSGKKREFDLDVHAKKFTRELMATACMIKKKDSYDEELFKKGVKAAECFFTSGPGKRVLSKKSIHQKWTVQTATRLFADAMSFVEDEARKAMPREFDVLDKGTDHEEGVKSSITKIIDLIPELSSRRTFSTAEIWSIFYTIVSGQNTDHFDDIIENTSMKEKLVSSLPNIEDGLPMGVLERLQLPEEVMHITPNGILSDEEMDEVYKKTSNKKETDREAEVPEGFDEIKWNDLASYRIRNAKGDNRLVVENDIVQHRVNGVIYKVTRAEDGVGARFMLKELGSENAVIKFEPDASDFVHKYRYIEKKEKVRNQ